MELNLIFNTEKQVLNIGDTVSLETLQNSIQGLFEQPLPEQFQLIYYLPNYEKQIITEQAELNQIIQQAILNNTKQVYLFIKKPDVVIQEEDLYSSFSNNNEQQKDQNNSAQQQQCQNQQQEIILESKQPQGQEQLIQSSKNYSELQQQQIDQEEEQEEQEDMKSNETAIKQVIRDQLSSQFEDIVELIYQEVKKELNIQKEQKSQQQQQPLCGGGNECEITIDLPNIIGRFLNFIPPQQTQTQNNNFQQNSANTCQQGFFGCGQNVQGCCQRENQQPNQECDNFFKCVGPILNQIFNNNTQNQQQAQSAGGCCSQQNCYQNSNTNPQFKQQQQSNCHQQQSFQNCFSPQMLQSIGPLIGQFLNQTFSQQSQQQQPQQQSKSNGGCCSNFFNMQQAKPSQQQQQQQVPQQAPVNQQQQQQQSFPQFFQLENMLRAYCMKQGLNDKQINDLVVRIKEFVGQNQEQLGEIIRNVCSGALSLDELLYNLQIKQ